MEKSIDHDFSGPNTPAGEACSEDIKEQATAAGSRSASHPTEDYLSQPKTVSEAVAHHEQRRALFQAESSQSKGIDSTVLQRELGPSAAPEHRRESLFHVESKEQAITRQRQLSRQMMEEVEQLLKVTQRQQREIRELRIKTEQQQEDMDRLAAEKHNQSLEMKTLRGKMEDTFEKGNVNKHEADREEKKLLKLHAEICQERETLDRMRMEIITQKNRTGKHEQKVTGNVTDSTPVNAVHKNIQLLIQAKVATEQEKTTLEHVKQELVRSKNCVLQHQDQVADTRRKLTVYFNKVKHLRDGIFTETEQKDEDAFDSSKVKLGNIWREMNNIWDVLEDGEMKGSVKDESENVKSESLRRDAESKTNAELQNKSNSLKCMSESIERQKRELDEKSEQTRKELRELEVLNTEIEMKKKHLVKMIRVSRRKKDTSRTMVEQQSQQLDGTDDTLREDVQQKKRAFAEEMKWRPFQEQKKKEKMEQRQKEETKHAFNNTVNTAVTSGQVKGSTREAVTEIKNTKVKMMQVQEQMERNNDEVKQIMDKLRLLRARVNRRTPTEPTAGHHLSAMASHPHELQQETERGYHVDQRQVVPADEDGAEGETVQTSVSSQLQDEERSGSGRQLLCSVDSDELYCSYAQMQTEIGEATLLDDYQTELKANVRQREEIQRQIISLRESEEKINSQMKKDVENVKEKTEEIKSLVEDLMKLHSQRPAGGELTVEEGGNIERPSHRENVNVFQHRVTTEVTNTLNSLILEVKKQRQSQDWKSDPQTQREKMEGASDERDKTAGFDFHRLRTEMVRTQELMSEVKLEVQNQPAGINADKNQKDEANETERFIQDITEFQEFLKMVKLYLKEQTGDVKSIKMSARKQRRDLDQRLEKTLRERDMLDLLKLKIQKQSEAIQEQLEKIAEMTNSMKKTAVKARNKSGCVDISIKRSQVNLRHLEDLNFNFTNKEKSLKLQLLSVTQLRAQLDEFKTQIRRTTAIETTQTERGENEKDDEEEHKNKRLTKSRRAKIKRQKVRSVTPTEETEAERETGKKANEQAEAEIHVSESLQRQREELEDEARKIKREIRESELLKSELEMKRRECEQVLRKITRKNAENDIMWSEIQSQKVMLRRETKKRRKELDQRLEKTMRARDELEILRWKLQQEREEVCRQRQMMRNWEKFIFLTQSLDFGSVQNIQPQLHSTLKSIRGDVGIMENVNLYLRNQKHEVTLLQSENRTMRDNVIKMKTQIMAVLKKKSLQPELENSEMVQMKEDIKQQNRDLDVKLDKVKRERRELELLQTQLEFQQKQNQHLIRKGLRKDREIKEKWAEVKEERDALKRETRKRNRELDQKLEKITRERDELEILQLRLQRQKDDSEVETQQKLDSTTKVTNQLQTLQEITETHMKTCEDFRRRSEYLNKVLKNKDGNISGQQMLMEARQEVEVMKTQIRRTREKFKHALKNMKQQQMEVTNEKDGKALDGNFAKQEEGIQRQHECEKQEESLRAEKLKEEPRSKRKDKVTRNEWEKTQKEKGKKNEETETPREDRENLRGVTHRQDVEHLLVPETLTATKDLIKLKAQLEQKKEDLEKMSAFEQKHAEFDLQGKQILVNCDMVHKKVNDLREILSDIERQRKYVENQRKEELQLKKHHLLKPKTELRIDRQKMNETMNTKKVELELMASVVQRQTELLERKQKGLRITETKLRETREHVDRLSDETHRQKIIIRGDWEKISQIKTHMNGEREVLMLEKTTVKVRLSELQKRHFEFLDRIKSLEVFRIKLRDQSVRLNKNINKMITSERNTDSVPMIVQVLEQSQKALDSHQITLTSYTERLTRGQEGLDRRRGLLGQRSQTEGLGFRSDVMDQRQVDVMLMMSVMEQQGKLLERERRGLQLTKAELQKTNVHTDGLLDEINREKDNIKDLKLQLQSQRNKLQDGMSSVAEKQREQELKEDEIKKQMEELDIQNKSMIAERETLQGLKKDIDKNKREVKAALTNISNEREELCQMKKQLEQDREILADEKKEVERQWSELKTKENEHVKETKRLKSHSARLEEQSEELEKKTMKLKLNRVKIQELVSGLEQNQTAVDKCAVTMATISNTLKMSLGLKTKELNEMMNKKMEQLEMMMSDIEREQRGLKNTQTDLLKTKEQTDILLTEINKEKSYIKGLNIQVQTQRNTLKDVITHTAERTSAEREELESLRNELDERKETFESALNSFSKEQDKLHQLKTRLDMERQELQSERDKVKTEVDRIKVREDQFMSRIQLTQQQIGEFKELNHKICSEINHKVELIDQRSKETQKLSSILEQKCAAFDSQRNQLMNFTDAVQKQVCDTQIILSIITKQRADMTTQWKEAVQSEKKQLEKLQSELKEERHGLNEILNKNKKLVFDMEQQKALIEQERSGLQITNTDVLKTRVHAESLLNEMKREESNIKYQKLQLRSLRNKLQEVIISVVLKHKQQEQKDDELKNQTEELHEVEKRISEESQDLMVLRKDLENNTARLFDEIDREKSNIKYLNHQVQSQRNNLQKLINSMALKDEESGRKTGELFVPKDITMAETAEVDISRKRHDSTGRVTEQQMTKEVQEEQFSKLESGGIELVDVNKSLKALKSGLQGGVLRMREDRKDRMINLEENEDNVQKLVSNLEQTQAALDAHKFTVTSYTETLAGEKDGLGKVLSEIQTYKLLNQKKCDLLHQDIQQKKEKCEFLRIEMQKKKEETDTLFGEINREKTSVYYLKLQLQEQKTKFDSVIDSMVLKLKQQQLKDEKIRRNSQELLNQQEIILVERKDLDLLKEDINVKRTEMEAAVNDLRAEREQLNQIKENTEKERGLLESGRKRLEEGWTEFKRQTQEIQTYRTRVLEQKEELDNFRKDVIYKKEKYESALSSMSEDTEKRNQARICLDIERQQLQSERGEVQAVTSEVKVKEDPPLRQILSINTLFGKLKDFSAKTNMDLREKMKHLEQNSKTTKTLSSALEQTLANFDLHRNTILESTDLVQGVRTDLREVLSDIVTERKTLIRERKEDCRLEKQHSDKLKAVIEKHIQQLGQELRRLQITKTQWQETIEHTHRMMQDAINLVVLTQAGQKQKDEEIKKQTQELHALRNNILEEKEEAEVMRKGFEASLNSLKEEGERFSRMKAEFEQDREMLLKEKNRMRGQWSELRTKENRIVAVMTSLNTFKIRLQQENERLSAAMKNSITRLEENKNKIQRTVSVVDLSQEVVNVHQATLAFYHEELAKEMESLRNVFSEIARQREDMEKHAVSEKRNLEKVQAELDEKREDLTRTSETVKQEKQSWGQMKSDIQKQSELLFRNVKDLRKKLEIMKGEMENNLNVSVKLSDQMKREKSNLEEFKLQIQDKRKIFYNVTERLVLKQKEQELKDDEIQKITRDLETKQKLIGDVDTRRTEAEAALDDLRVEKERWRRIKATINEEREILKNKKNEIEEQWTEIKRQSEEIQTHKNTVLAEKGELKILRNVVRHRKEQLEYALSNITGEREKLHQEKTSLKITKQRLEAERGEVQEELSSVRDREDQLKRKMLSIQTLTAKLKERGDMEEKAERLEQRSKETHKLSFDLEQNIANFDLQRNQTWVYKNIVQIKTSELKDLMSEIMKQKRDREYQRMADLQLGKHLNRLQTELNVDRGELNETVNRSKVMMSVMEQQTELLDRGLRGLQVIKSELQKTQVHAGTLSVEIDRQKSSIKSLNLQIQNFKNKLLVVIDSVGLKQKEEELKDEEIRRQTEERQSLENKVSEQAGELDLLKRERLLMKCFMKQQTELLDQEKRGLQVTNVELHNTREHAEHLFNEIERQKSIMTDLNLEIQSQKNKLQGVIYSKQKEEELKDEEIRRQTEELQSVKNKVSEQAGELDILKRERLLMNSVTSQQTQLLEQRRGDVQVTKAEVQKTQEHVGHLFDEIDRHKSDLKDLNFLVQSHRKKLQEAIYSVGLRQREQEVKDDEIRWEKEELQRQKMSVWSDREELDSKRHWIERKKDELSLMNAELEQERELLMDERKRMEGQWSGLMIKENKLRNENASLEAFRTRLTEQNQKIKEDLENKTARIKHSQDSAVKIVSVLEQSQKALGEHRVTMTSCTDTLEKERHGLRKMLSEIVRQRQDTDHQLNSETVFNKARQEVKAEKRETTEDMREMVIKAKQVLDQRRSDIQRQCDCLKFGIKREKKNMETIRTEIQKKKEDTDTLLDMVTALKIYIQEQKSNINKSMSSFVLKQKEQELREDEIQRKTEQLQRQKETIRKEREELDVMRKDLNERNKDLDGVNQMLQLLWPGITVTSKSLAQDVQEKTGSFRIKNVELINKMRNTDVLLDKIQQTKIKMEDLSVRFQAESCRFKNALQTFAQKQQQTQIAEVEFTKRSEVELHDPDAGKQKDIISKESHHFLKLDTLEEKETLGSETGREDSMTEEETKTGRVEGKLKELEARMRGNISHRLNMLEQSKTSIQRWCSILEQKTKEFQRQKEQIACCTELLGREKEGLMSVLTDMVQRREKLKSQQTRLEQMKADLKRERDDLGEANTLIKEEKIKLKLVKSDNMKETERIEQDKIHLQEEKDKLEAAVMEVQMKHQRVDSLYHDMNQEKQKLQEMKINLEKVRDGSESHLSKVLSTMMDVRAKLKVLNRRTSDFNMMVNNMEHKCKDVVRMISELELKCTDFDSHKNVIAGFYEHMINKKSQAVTREQAVQTEDVPRERPSEGDVTRQAINKDTLTKDDHKDMQVHSLQLENVAIVTEDVDNKTGHRYPTRSMGEQRDNATNVMSKRETLRQIWKDTKKERKEIDRMMDRGQEMKNNLEKRLEVINRFVKRTWLQKDKEPQKTKVERGSVQSTPSTSYQERCPQLIDEKYAELQQLKVEMLRNIEKLHIRETERMSDKANQTSQVDLTSEHWAGWTDQPASHEQTVTASEAPGRLLSQLCHYCSRCCCSCCACCKQVCSEEQ